MLTWPYLNALKNKIYSFAPGNSTLIKNFIIYASGSLILRSISLLLAPITLTLLSPTNYGLLALVQSFTNIFVVFLGLGLRQVFALEYFHHTSHNRKIILHDVVGIYSMCAIPVLILIAWHAPIVNTYIFVGNADNQLIYLSLVFCFVYFFAELVYQTLQYQCNATALTLLQTTVALLTICCNVGALRWGFGVHGMLGSYIVGMLITCAYGTYAYTKNHTFMLVAIKPTFKKIAYYIPLGLPFIPSVLCSWMLSSGSRWLLARYATLHDVGIYALADTVGALFQMLVLLPMSGSYLPYLFKKFNASKHDLHTIETWNKKNMWIAMATMLALITLGYIVGKPLLRYFVPPAYHSAFDYMWFILITNILLMGTYFTSALIQFHKRAYLLLMTLAVPAIINIFLGMLLIPRYGIAGAISALTTAYIGYFVITLTLNKRILLHTKGPETPSP